jgi:hypothetical protein
MVSAMRYLLIVGLGLLASACGNLQGGPTRGVTAELMTAPMPVPGCTVDREFSLLGVDGLFRFDILTVNRNPRAIEYLDHKTPAGDYLMPLYDEVAVYKTVPRYSGPDLELTITVLGINAPGVPEEIPYLSGMAGAGPKGDGICRGYIKVEKLARNEIRFKLPMRGGEHLGQVSGAIPRKVLEGYPQALVCVTWPIDVEVPKLDLGPRKGSNNTSCGLPGNWSGYTRVGEAIAKGQKWILFGAIPKEVKPLPLTN